MIRFGGFWSNGVVMNASGFTRGARGVSTGSVVIAVVVSAAVVAGAFFALRVDTTGRGGNRLPKEFQIDVAFSRTIDPNLFRYEQVERLPVGAERVSAIAVGPGDSIYVAGDKSIHVLDRDGKPTGVISTDNELRCLAVAGDGTIYGAHAGSVVVYSPDGEIARTWKAGGDKAVVTGIAISGEDVFVATYRRRSGEVRRYDTAGKLVGRIGPKQDDGKISSFVVPSAYFNLAVAPDGLLRVAHTGRRLVEAYTFDGDREFAWGQSCAGIEGFTGCCNPADLAILPDGGIVTSEKGALRSVKVYRPDGPYDPKGTLEGVVLSGKPGSTDPTWAVAADTRGRILVLDRKLRAVLVFVRKESK